VLTMHKALSTGLFLITYMLLMRKPSVKWLNTLSKVIHIVSEEAGIHIQAAQPHALWIPGYQAASWIKLSSERQFGTSSKAKCIVGPPYDTPQYNPLK
jgi:hypothetical protein